MSLEGIMKRGMYGAQRALFVTPMYFAAEVASGLEGSQSIKTRLMALGVNFAVAEFYQKWFKPKITNLMGVTEHSSGLRKDLANRVAFAAHQLPLYTGILALAGASLEQMAVAVPTGIAIGAATAGSFQNFMNEVGEFIESGVYKTKEAFSRIKRLGESYAKNLAVATAIAVFARIGISNTVDYFKENNVLTHPERFVSVYDVPTEGWIYVKRENFDPKRQMLIFSEDRSKVHGEVVHSVF